MVENRAHIKRKEQGWNLYLFIWMNLILIAIHTILDEEAFALVKELAAKEGLLVGSSSGSAFAAALKEAKIAPKGTNIVVIFPDASDRYLSKKIYQGGI